MKKVYAFLFTALSIPVLLSCKKDSAEDPVLKTYTVMLDMRPSQNNPAGAPVTLDNTKSVFLSLSKGAVYNINNAQANAAAIDVVIYDGGTTPTGTGDVHFVSPGGGSLSLKTAPGSYMYLSPGTTNTGVSYFTLTGMDKWTAYNTTSIRDEKGLNGVDVASFDGMTRLSQFSAAVNKVKQTGTNNSNQAKVLYNVDDNALASRLWYFEFHSGTGTKTAFVKVVNQRYLPDGYVELQVKMPE